MADQPPVSVTYITGISYCGSTLLAVVLNAHPGVVSIGEMGPSRASATPDYTCSCGERVAECPFFTEVARRMREQGVDFDPGDMRLRHNDNGDIFTRLLRRSTGVAALDRLRDALPPVRARLDDYARRNEAFIRAALDTSGAQVFLDATKHADRIPLLQRMNVDLRVIHLVRDPRGYLHSARKHDNTDAESAARDFIRGHSQIERHLARVPRDHRMRINYETICADPGHWLAQLTLFMGLDAMDVPGDFRAHDYHVIGNRMRNRGDERTTITLDEKWRTTLSEDDIATVARIAGPLARRYGYEI